MARKDKAQKKAAIKAKKAVAANEEVVVIPENADDGVINGEPVDTGNAVIDDIPEEDVPIIESDDSSGGNIHISMEANTGANEEIPEGGGNISSPDKDTEVSLEGADKPLEDTDIKDETRLSKLVNFYVKTVEAGGKGPTAVAMQQSILEEVLKGYPGKYSKKDLIDMVKDNEMLQGASAHSFNTEWSEQDLDKKNSYYNLITFLGLQLSDNKQPINKIRLSEQFRGKYTAIGDQLIIDFLQ